MICVLKIWTENLNSILTIKKLSLRNKINQEITFKEITFNQIEIKTLNIRIYHGIMDWTISKYLSPF